MPFYTAVGGALVDTVTIRFTGAPPVSHEDMMGHVEQARSLELPVVNGLTEITPASNGRKLAVLGGGPSINEHVDTLKGWDGDIWAINGAYHWCQARQIASTFIACDPHEIVAQWAVNVEKALMSTRCHPKAFEVLRNSGAAVETFELDGDKKIMAGSSTATSSFHLALISGYRDVTYFGCESSYPPKCSHAYMHEAREHELAVSCGGEEFHTAPDFLCQAIEMANVLRMAVNGLKEQSGGLLRAMIKTPEYRITWVSEGLMSILAPVTTN